MDGAPAVGAQAGAVPLEEVSRAEEEAFQAAGRRGAGSSMGDAQDAGHLFGSLRSITKADSAHHDYR